MAILRIQGELMKQPASKKLPVMQGGAKLSHVKPKKQSGPQGRVVDHNGAGTFASGPKRKDVIGKMGGSLPKDGTKAQKRGITSGGKASGKRGNVKA